MEKGMARAFAALMESYLDIPSSVCELIEHKLTKGECAEVIEYVVQRKRELKLKEEG